MVEYLIVLLFALALIVAPIVLLIVAFVRSSRINELSRRVDRLENAVRELLREKRAQPAATAPEPAAEPEPVLVSPPPVAPVPSFARSPSRAPSIATIDWESFIGRRALGWVAVVLIIFATAFFLRYAYQNNWIGPIGRVTLAAVAGLALVVAGWYYDRRRGWRLFAQMLSGAGVVLIYLAAYSSFGFYHLLPQRSAAPYLLIIVVETMVLAVEYDAPALALVAVAGGLLTPVLMHSETDQYTSLFLYLALLDAGVVILAMRRPWPVVTSVALLGTQLLFWLWYGENYHPEKMHAALVFQAAVFLLFLGQTLAAHVLGPRPRAPRWEDLGRWLVNAFSGFFGFYVLLNPDFGPWMGTLAVTFAALYASLAWRMLIVLRDDERLYLTTLAIAVGFIAAALPIEAHASWIALGWGAEAAALWWFGLRVRQVPLRGLGAVLALMATVRVLYDTLEQTHAPYLPVLNDYALPAIGASACLMAAVGSTRRLQQSLGPGESLVAAAVAVIAVLQLWLILSVDLYGYCDSIFGRSVGGDDRFAQMALSLLWAGFASAVLAAGFRFHQARLRWTALALYGVTVVKVFVFDMAGLDEIYRILAFLVLAILLGVAARVYQRIRPEQEKAGPVEV